MNLKNRILKILNFASSGQSDGLGVGFGFDVPAREAIRHFEQKGLKPTFSYADMAADEHRSAFTVAKMMDMDLLQDMQDSIRQALKQGWSYQQWADRIIPHLQANGWWGRQAVLDPITGQTVIAELGSARRLQVIFRTNLQSAYAVGRWQKIMQQKDQAPFLLYDAVDDHRTRPQHRAWNNKVLPVDHPFWRTHTPPNGYMCRCSVIQLSQDDLDDMGLTVSESPDVQMVEWKNPRTGQIERIPKGVDAGFGANLSQARYDMLQRLAQEKMMALEDAQMRAAAQQAFDDAPKPVDLIPSLIEDSNKAFPLTEKNAKTVLYDLAPKNYFPQRAAGSGGAGADLIFQSMDGTSLFKIENKCTQKFSDFKGHLSHAAQNQAAGSLVFFQVPDGTDVSKWLARFWGYRKHLINSQDPLHIAAMNAYKTTKVVIYSASGVLLLPMQLIYQAQSE